MNGEPGTVLRVLTQRQAEREGAHDRNGNWQPNPSSSKGKT